MAEVSRRTAVAFFLLAPAGFLAACAPGEANTGGSPSAVPSAAPSGSPSAGAALPPAPAGVAGPTGANWPSRTPLPGDAFDAVEECDCSWASIAAAIEKVDRAAPDGKARVLVRPGTLGGDGAGSTKTPVLERLGTEGRAFRVLVTPRDGVGSVDFDSSIRIDAVVGVAFIGFWLFPSSIVLTSVRDFAWGWSKGQAFNITAGASGPAEAIELVECVTPEATSKESDTWAFRTGDHPYRDISMLGCYLAPSYKPDGSGAHCDTLQLSGDPDKNGLLIRSSVIFASTNAGFIPSAGATGILFDGSLLVGGDRMLVRYPLPPGSNAFTSGPPAAVNAAGSVDQMSAHGSTFIGNVRGTFLDVLDSSVSGAEPPAATSGAFTSDPSLSDIDEAWLEARAPMPTDERLRQIWALT